jgi:hypothetical protein
VIRRALRHNGLGLFFLVIFLAALAGQAVAGHAKFNEDEIAHARLLHQSPETVSLGRYVTSADFARSVAENWQSEYLQFAVFILAGIYLVQRGSTESKTLDAAGPESDEEQQIGEHADEHSPLLARVGGWRTAIYGHSLLAVMLAIFFASWFAQSIAGRSVYNDQQIEHKEATVSWGAYVRSADFWESTLENWQSEFLAVGSMAVFSIYLRQRGSSQSKPVGAGDTETATEG